MMMHFQKFFLAALIAMVVSVTTGSNVFATTISFQEDQSPTGAYQTGVALMQKSTPDTVSNNSSMFAGTISPTIDRITRGLLSFDITFIPAGATINSVKLDLTARGPDSSSVSEIHTISLHELTTPFIETESTWNNATSTTAWSTPGGDFNATAITSLTANPNTVQADDVFTFGTNASFVSLAQTALDGSGVISLLVDSDSNTDDDRGLFRFAADDSSDSTYRYPKLTIDYSMPVPEPSSIAMLMALAFGGLGFAFKKKIAK